MKKVDMPALLSVLNAQSASLPEQAINNAHNVLLGMCLLLEVRNVQCVLLVIMHQIKQQIVSNVELGRYLVRQDRAFAHCVPWEPFRYHPREPDVHSVPKVDMPIQKDLLIVRTVAKVKSLHLQGRVV